MGRRGPQPKPTALKVLDGTYRRDRHGDIGREPGEPIDAIPQPPESLGEVGVAVWNDTLAVVLSGRYVTAHDLRAFALYCRTFDEVAALDEKIGDKLVVIGGQGGEVTNPLVVQRFKWLEIQGRYEKEFWLTPTARAGKQGAAKKAAPNVTGARKRG